MRLSAVTWARPRLIIMISVGCLSLLPLQLSIVILHELPNLVGKIQEPLPLLDVEGYRHALETINADGAFFTDLAVQ